uniref:Uncharacterized protein n=1 Tax=Timema genevievae TaxID=629358 RepID=A0A7R9JMJ3_TIMGE|nr:unnamed protein product [Timema genevievae]
MNIRLEDVKRDPGEIMAQEERERDDDYKQNKVETNPPEIEVERSWVHSGEGYEAQLVCIVHGEPAPEGEGGKHSFKLDCSSDPDLIATSILRMDETNGIVPLDWCRFGSQRHPVSFKPSPVTSSLIGSLRAFPPNKRRTFHSPYSRSRDVVRLDGLDVAT